jgi:hypothetical protein
LDHAAIYENIFNKFNQFAIDGKYTDARLIIKDVKQIVTVNVHRVILAVSCEYFDKLFSFGDGPGKSEFEIITEDSIIFHEIIAGIYGQRMIVNYTSNQILKIMKCRDFLGLTNDVSLLYGLKIDETDYPFLLDTAVSFDIDNDPRLLATICDNIPVDYDLNNFSRDFLRNIIEKRNGYLIVEERYLEIWDTYSDSLVRTCCIFMMPLAETRPIRHDYCLDIDNSSKRLFEAFFVYSTDIAVYKKPCVRMHSTIGSVINASPSHDGSILVYNNNQQEIIIFNKKSGAQNKMDWICGYDTKAVAISPNNSHLVYNDRFDIIVRNIETGKIHQTWSSQLYTPFIQLIYSPDGTKIAALGDGKYDAYIYILDTTTCNLIIRFIAFCGGGINNSTLAFSHDNRYIIATANNTVFIGDIITYKKIATCNIDFDYHKFNISADTILLYILKNKYESSDYNVTLYNRFLTRSSDYDLISDKNLWTKPITITDFIPKKLFDIIPSHASHISVPHIKYTEIENRIFDYLYPNKAP